MTLVPALGSQLTAFYKYTAHQMVTHESTNLYLSCLTFSSSLYSTWYSNYYKGIKKKHAQLRLCKLGPLPVTISLYNLEVV